MSNLRLTIVMFVFAAALAPALLVSWHSGKHARVTHVAQGPVAPVAPPGFKTAPWEGSTRKRIDDPAKAGPPPTAPSTAPASAPNANPTASANGPVVVELFTSEGCSSCPPAERLINELAAAQPADSGVYFLAFHVDYWDKLGWKDRFATSAFSERQREYAKAFDTATVFTPQTIVNGEAGFVGSDKTRTESAIAAAKLKPAQYSVEAKHSEIKPGESVKIECTLTAIKSDAAPVDARICIALVEDGLSTTVKRGENDGRTLKHDRVVRAFAETAAVREAPIPIELKVPSDLNPARATIVVFVRNSGSMTITAAATSKPAVAAAKP